MMPAIKSIMVLLGALLANGAAFVQVQSTIRARSSRSCSSTSLAGFANVNENAQRDVGAMDQWATSTCGIQKSEGFQLRSDDGLDYSAVTTSNVPQGSPVLSIPAGVIMRTSTAKQELGINDAAIGHLNRNGAGDQVPLFYLFLKVISEYQKGEQSPYYPWINAMPRLFYNAVSMTDFCYECLPPLVYRLARQEKVKFDNYFDALQKVDAIDPQLRQNKEVAKWAFNVVTTRSFGPENEKYIAPLGDMFNHGTETEIDLSFDDNGNLYALANRDIPAGSPLRMSYGCPTNPSQLFAQYGFLDETSPATFCKIMNISPTQQLLDIGYGFDKMLFYKDSGDVSQEVWDVLLYQALANRRDAQQAFYEAHMRGDAQTKQNIHGQHFLETSTALKTHVDTFLQQLDELSRKSVGQDVSRHPRLPLILKHNEFVRGTFLRVKQNLDPMVAQAAGQPVMM